SNTAMKWTSLALRDWQIGGVFQYQSGAIIAVPSSNNQLFAQLNLGGGLFSGGSTYYNFANGKVPSNFFTVNPNDVGKTMDPTRAFVADKSIWVDAAPGQYATSAAYYSNYRWQRQPSESMNFGRNFRMGRDKRMNLQIRAEFQNILNRH